MAEQNEKKITKAVDKLVMGMIIGGAVGSVIGMAFSPKSGKQNRKIVKDKAVEMGQDFMQEHHKEISEAKQLLNHKSKGVFSFVKKTLGIKKNKQKIPHELDV